jgi:hypothetical protein
MAGAGATDAVVTSAAIAGVAPPVDAEPKHSISGFIALAAMNQPVGAGSISRILLTI